MNTLAQLKKIKRFSVVMTLSALFTLAGCQSTQTNVTSVGPSMSGPGSSKALGKEERSYSYNSNVYLNVAIPVFDPGLPKDEYGNIDDEELVEEDIWPQVRRLEANRFAVNTREALSDTKAFGAVNVTPDANVSADVYVLGKINYSDTETVEIGVRVMDASNQIWGEEEFEYQVGEGFYRDALRKGENPYGPIFKSIAGYVYDLLMKKSDEEKKTIQAVSDMRYATMYSPEAFGGYLGESSNFFSNRSTITLTGAPAESDPMYQRVNVIKAKDEQFIDSLQDSYDTFYASTHDAYRTYQQETLPVAIDIRRKKEERTRAQVGAGILATAAILLGKNSGSTAGQVASAAAGLGAVYSLSEAIKTNRELGTQRALLDEMGQNLDIKVTPQVVELNEQNIELTGTAGEQYAQLREKLKEIYDLESTPLTQL